MAEFHWKIWNKNCLTDLDQSAVQEFCNKTLIQKFQNISVESFSAVR